MRALQLVEINRMAIVDLPAPDAAPGEVVLEIIAAGICGSDIHGFTGDNGRRHLGQVMGHEAVGRIHAVGDAIDPTLAPRGAIATFNPLILSPENMRTFAGREQHDPERKVIGVDPDLVSAFAQYIAVPLRNLVVLPESMPVLYGALIEPLAVALNAVRRVGPVEGQSVLVIGGGPIGQSAVLAALHLGASSVFVSEPDAARRELCARLGAVVLDPGEGTIPTQIFRHHGGPVDVAIDAVGVSATLSDALGATSFGGRVCLVGMGAQELGLAAFRISTEERSIVGAFCYSFDCFREAAEWVGTGDPVFANLISAEVDLNHAPEAFTRLAGDADVPGKLLIRLSR